MNVTGFVTARYDEGTALFFMTELALILHLVFTPLGAGFIQKVSEDGNPISFGMFLGAFLLAGVLLLYLTIRGSDISESFAIYAIVVIFTTGYLSSLTYMITHERAIGWDRWYGAASMILVFIFLFRIKNHIMDGYLPQRMTRRGLAYCAMIVIVMFTTVRIANIDTVNGMSIIFSIVLAITPFLPLLPGAVVDRFAGAPKPI